MSDDRLLDLLAGRVTEGLDPERQAELDRMLAAEDAGDAVGRELEEMELAAAALDLALLEGLAGEGEPVPPALRARILEAVATVEQSPAEPAVSSALVPDGAAEARVLPMRPRPSVLPWLAAAAGLLLAVLAWWPQLRSPAPSPPPEPVVVVEPSPPPPPTAAELRGDLIARASDETVLPWTATEDPAALEGAGGDVVWSGEQQAGFMRFRGLAANDPGEYQYQLWIFDQERDERYPVDGGVFDVPAGAGEVIVPIRAKLPVGEPYLFAITVEPPGGVVVSSRERIALVAQPPQPA